MKFSLTLLLSALVGGAAADLHADITADSKLGQNLLSQARRLDDNGDDADFTWVTGYSLKFQGCHHIQQWNDNADDEEDVRIQTKRLVRFRLCPTKTCSSRRAAGCTSGYGDYVVDMNTYVESYFEAKRQADEYECQMHLNYKCDCEDDDGKGDDFDRDYCEYDCFNDAGMSQCIDRNPYEDDENEQERFEPERYMECAEFEVPENDDANRRLEDGDDDEEQFFIGPYCADQGGKILLGMFSDDTCTQFADDYGGKETFKGFTGMTLPYSKKSIVGSECVSCVEQRDANEDNGNDADDEDQVREQCENVYAAAGKCEQNLPEGITDDINNNGCQYIEGIRVAFDDKGYATDTSRPNSVVTAFIVIFAMAFAALGFYVWYLRTRLGVKKTALM